MKTSVAALLLALCCALCACSHREISEYWQLPPEGWPYDMHLCMQPQACDSDSIVVGTIALVIRHAADYEYANLYVELQYADADTLITDTLNLRLADEFGHWQGTGMGVDCQYVDTVVRAKPISLSQPIRLRHIMRADTLYGVEQAGIVLVSEP